MKVRYFPPREPMAYEQHFIKDGKKKTQPRTHVRMAIEGMVVRTAELQEGTAATDPGAIWRPLHAQDCGSDFRALAYADGQEWMRLNKGWRLATPGGELMPADSDAARNLKPLHPGPLAALAQAVSFPTFRLPYYFEYAVSRVAVVWEWDRPQRAAELQARMAPEQMALWAIANADGQICNGGFSQFFYNSYGELAHEALDGFALLGLTAFADILRQAYAVFPGQRIPKDRDERVAILEALTLEDDDAVAAARLQVAGNGIEHAFAIFKGTEDLWDELETRYYALIHQDIGVRGYNAAFYKPLCECIEARSHEVFR